MKAAVNKVADDAADAKRALLAGETIHAAKEAAVEEVRQAASEMRRAIEVIAQAS